MKSTVTGLAVVLMFAASSYAAAATYSGEIMDSACAASGSHAAMTQKNSKLTPKTCTTACVQHGAKYVLYDEATKTTYQLDDQKKPAQFAGEKVAITGTLNDASKTIHVTGIKAS